MALLTQYFVGGNAALDVVECNRQLSGYIYIYIYFRLMFGAVLIRYRSSLSLLGCWRDTEVGRIEKYTTAVLNPADGPKWYLQHCFPCFCWVGLGI